MLCDRFVMYTVMSLTPPNKRQWRIIPVMFRVLFIPQKRTPSKSTRSRIRWNMERHPTENSQTFGQVTFKTNEACLGNVADNAQTNLLFIIGKRGMVRTTRHQPTCNGDATSNLIQPVLYEAMNALQASLLPRVFIHISLGSRTASVTPISQANEKSLCAFSSRHPAHTTPA